MATERSNQSQSQGKTATGNVGGDRHRASDTGTDEELEGTTVDGDEVTASLDDDEDSLSASASASDDDADVSEQRGSQPQRGGSGNFANDPQRASEGGRKGGKH